MARRRIEVATRFWAKVARGDPDECWEWQAFCQPQGYGMFWNGETMRLAHRIAYELEHGAVPEGLSVCHSCDNPPCVNPAHLWAGTNGDNNLDRDRKGRTVATRGTAHPLAKLTDEAVLEIRRRCRDGERQRIVGADYGIGQALVSRIMRGVSWPHIQQLERAHDVEVPAE